MTASTPSGLSRLRRGAPLLQAMVRDHPTATLRVLLVLGLSAVAQGLGLLALVPILQTLDDPSAGAHSVLGRVVAAVGLPPTLAWLLVGYAVVAVGAAGLAAWANVLMTRRQLEFVDALRARMLAAVGQAWWRTVVTLRRADLINSLTVSISSVASGAYAAASVAVASVLIIGQLAVAFVVAPAAAALALSAAMVMVGLISPLVRRSRRLGRDLVTTNQHVVHSATGFLDGLKMAKAHQLVDEHVTAFRGATKSARAAQMGLTRAVAWASTVQSAATVGILAVIVHTAYTRLHVSVPHLLVLALIFSRIMPQVAQLQRGLMQLAQASAAYEDVLGVITTCEAAAEPAPAPTRLPRQGRRGSIRLDAVVVGYSPERPVLRGVDLEIPAGRTTALVGPSGAGKTTVTDVVLGLLRPESGQVLVDGAMLTDEDLPRWRSRVAVVPQDPYLFTETIAANLRWATPQASDEDLWAALHEAAADTFVAALPDGLDTVVGDRGIRLSGGERQRIVLARALLRRPALIVLDEPTSALDTETEQLVRASLARLHGRYTVLIVAHRLSTARDADQIVVLDAGRVVESGPWAELAADPQGRLSSLIRAGAFDVPTAIQTHPGPEVPTR